VSGLYLAKELGYFADLGLQIHIERVAASAQAIPLAAAGKLDAVFCASSASLVNAIARGSRLRIVAGRDIAAPSCPDLNVLYGRRAVFPNGLQDIRIIKGKRVAADLTIGTAQFGVDMILASAGMTLEELGVMDLNKPELILSLLSGKVDAIIVSDFARRFVNVADQIVRGISLADVLPNHQVSFVVFGARLLDGEPDIGSKFLSAYLRGVREYLGGKTPRFHDELAASNGMDPVQARKACRDSIVPDGRIDLPSLERFVQWATAKGFCPVSIPAAKLVDMRFLEMQGSKHEDATRPVVALPITGASQS